ncbi:hypothetical protein [Helcococcus ovis]
MGQQGMLRRELNSFVEDKKVTEEMLLNESTEEMISRFLESV